MPESSRYQTTTTLEDTPCGDVPADVVVGGPPHNAAGMTVYPLDSQRVQDKISIEPDRLGIVADGLDDYLAARKVDTRSIPSTYSNWDDELPDDAYGRRNIPVVTGPAGRREDRDGAIRLCYRSKHVRAGVRILTGGGRFNPDNFALHLAIPFAVLEHDNSAVAIAPILNPVENSPDTLAFTYREGEAGDEFAVDHR